MPPRVERSAECVTGARETRHDGSDGNARGGSQLPVGQTLELAEDDQLMKTIGQTAYRARDRCAVIDLKQ
jgi:hypothetical protein